MDVTSDTVMRLFANTVPWTLEMLFSFMDVKECSLRPLSSTYCLPSLNTQHQRPTICQDITSSPYTVGRHSWMTDTLVPVPIHTHMHWRSRCQRTSHCHRDLYSNNLKQASLLLLSLLHRSAPASLLPTFNQQRVWLWCVAIVCFTCCTIFSFKKITKLTLGIFSYMSKQ